MNVSNNRTTNARLLNRQLAASRNNVVDDNVRGNAECGHANMTGKISPTTNKPCSDTDNNSSRITTSKEISATQVK